MGLMETFLMRQLGKLVEVVRHTDEVLGYIVMGLLAFLLGVCVTVLLYRLRRRNERRSREEKEDEL